MKYFGGKNRLGKKLAPLINEFINKETLYIEPFVGGAGLLPHLDLERCKGVYLNDLHPYLMSMWEQIKDGWWPTNEWNPRTYSEYMTDGQKIYDYLRPKHKYLKDFENEEKYSKGFIGYFGFQSCYSGRWFEGLARDTSPNATRIFFNDGFKSLELKRNKILNIGDKLSLTNLDYKDFITRFLGSNNVVCYLDPPYISTKWYTGITKQNEGINYDEFWDLTRNLSKNNWVFISEEQAPDDFVDILSVDYTRGMKTDGKNVKTKEKLYIHKSRYEEALMT